MENQTKQLKGYPVTFNIYAYDEQEVEEFRRSIIDFIGQHAKHGRAVTAHKVAQAVSRWDQNTIVKNQIINYFKQ